MTATIQIELKSLLLNKTLRFKWADKSTNAIKYLIKYFIIQSF